MRDVTTEQRLRLIQQVRSRYHENQYDLSSRERILYGKSFTRDTPDKAEQENGVDDPGPSFSFFKLRLVIALLLGAAVISMDRNHIKIAGITSEQIYQAISADFEENIEKMVEAMSRDTTPED